MKQTELAAARRRNTIAELVESMRSAQRDARINGHTANACVMVRVPPQIGIWKGGCK